LEAQVGGGAEAVIAARVKEVLPDIAKVYWNNKISAIKLVRQLTRWSLKESKDVVDAEYARVAPAPLRAPLAGW